MTRGGGLGWEGAVGVGVGGGGVGRGGGRVGGVVFRAP